MEFSTPETTFVTITRFDLSESIFIFSSIAHYQMARPMQINIAAIIVEAKVDIIAESQIDSKAN